MKQTIGFILIFGPTFLALLGIVFISIAGILRKFSRTERMVAINLLCLVFVPMIVGLFLLFSSH